LVPEDTGIDLLSLWLLSPAGDTVTVAALDIAATSPKFKTEPVEIFIGATIRVVVVPFPVADSCALAVVETATTAVISVTIEMIFLMIGIDLG
jgi:hypothetical protein